MVCLQLGDRRGDLFGLAGFLRNEYVYLVGLAVSMLDHRVSGWCDRSIRRRWSYVSGSEPNTKHRLQSSEACEAGLCRHSRGRDMSAH